MCNLTDWIMIAITLVYVVATIFIWRANQKSAKMAEKQIDESRKALQKSIDMQLYDKRLAVANNFEENNYSNSTMEISLLFGNTIFHMVKELRTLIEQQCYWQKEYDSYWKAVNEQELYNYDLENYASSPDATEKILKECSEMNERCRIVYIDGCDEDGNQLFYDYSEISKNLNDINDKVSKKQKELKRKVWHLMQDKISVEQEVTNEK